MQAVAHGIADAKAPRDVDLRLAFVHELPERIELVGWMHRFANDILGQTHAARLFGRNDAARDWMVGGVNLLLHQQAQCLQSASPATTS